MKVGLGKLFVRVIQNKRVRLSWIFFYSIRFQLGGDYDKFLVYVNVGKF